MPDAVAVRSFPILVALIAALALGGCARSSKPPADIEARIAAVRPDLAEDLRNWWPDVSDEAFAAELERAEKLTRMTAAKFHMHAIQLDIVDEQMRAPSTVTLPATGPDSVAGDLTFRERESIVEHAVLHEFASKVHAVWLLRDGLVLYDIDAKEFMHDGDDRTAVTVNVEADVEGRTITCNLIYDLSTRTWNLDTLSIGHALYMHGEWVAGVKPEPL